ncbi:hypothetical protein [Akkermansia sp.]|uniref:hypothetical protein n=1 Tax=Akkermansia sp. TaxID=1872421 RepID=UPI003A8C9469
MNILIIIASLLLSLGSSGWFIRTYYNRNAEYRCLTEEEINLSEKKSELFGKLKNAQNAIAQSHSLESIRTNMEYTRQRLSNLDEEHRDILSSTDRLRRQEKQHAALQQEIDKLQQEINNLQMELNQRQSSKNRI